MDDSSPAKTLEHGSEGKLPAGITDADETELELGLGLRTRVRDNGGAGVSVFGGERDAGVGNAPDGAVVVEKPKGLVNEIRVSVEEEEEEEEEVVEAEEEVTVGSGGEAVVKAAREGESGEEEIRVEIVLGINESGGKGGSPGVSGPENGVAADDAADGSANLGGGRGGDEGESSKEDDTMGKDEEEEMDDEEDEEGEESGDQDVQFAVGDFVWGKIKSHPWWPGQIYDPTEASEFAGRFRRRDRLLVAYFGDGTFAWCYPSQLRSFGKEFARLHKQSSSRSFVYAVEKALDEFGRCVESQMTCSCVEARPKLVKPFTMNAGIKEGVTVPDGRIAEHSITGFHPVEFLAGLKDVARSVSVSNTLELTVLKSRLSAFYHAKGYGDLPVCYEPQGITDPEEFGDVNVSEGTGFEGMTDGSTKVDGGGEFLAWRGASQKSNLVPSSKGPDMAEDKLLQRKKQRSMAELMAGGTDSDVENDSHGGVEGGKEQQGKSTSASRKRKKNEQAQEGKDEPKQASQSGKHKKASPYASLSVAVEEDNKPFEDENQDDGADEGHLLSSPRKRKKSKYLSPPYTMLVSKTGNSSKDAEAEAEAEAEATPKLLKITEIGEGMRKAAAKLTGAPPIIKCSGETFQKKAPKRGDSEEKTPRSSSPRTPKLKEKKLGIEEYNVAPEDMLCDLSSAAVNPFFVRDDESSDSIKAFFEKFRDSLYVRGSDYNTYKGGKKRKLSTIKDADVTDKSDGKSGEKDSTGGRMLSKASTGGGSDRHGRKGSSSRKQTPSTSESIDNSVPPETKDSDEKTNHKEINGGGPAALILTFGQGTTFPSNEDLIAIFDKFGELNKSETAVLGDLGCARVVFLRSSDAEKAFNSSDKISALRTVVVSYRLRYLCAPPKASEVETPVAQTHAKASMSEDGKCGTPEGLRSQTDPTLMVIKKNLESMMSTLSHSGEGDMGSQETLSPDVRENLMGEIKGLLKKVTKLVDPSSQA
ncbi:hypothetical protein H6P81_009887 [Aristolochia fimbriata]|uniref:PWWP domain-containing protein n=1 Tax=Aristolochia fimbriata TaxID=158543 RepID=A0AAV7EQL0_ARIFI|nr:hypothetical protein H6P81_009887 [Aristolochia fimbriata]